VNVISPSPTCSWINIPINQSGLRDKLVKFRLTIFRCFCYSPIIPSDFRETLRVGLGLDVNLVPGSTKYVDPGTSLGKNTLYHCVPPTDITPNSNLTVY